MRLAPCVIVLLLALGACSTSDTEPEAAVCRLGLVDPTITELAAEAERASRWMPEVTDAQIARRAEEVISIIREVDSRGASVGSVAYLAMLDSVIDLNDACTAAGV